MSAGTLIKFAVWGAQGRGFDPGRGGRFSGGGEKRRTNTGEFVALQRSPGTLNQPVAFHYGVPHSPVPKIEFLSSEVGYG